MIAQQSGTTVDAYLAPAGETVMLLATGTVSSTQMISNALSENKMITWILRGVTLVMLAVGFSLLLGPISIQEAGDLAKKLVERSRPTLFSNVGLIKDDGLDVGKERCSKMSF